MAITIQNPPVAASEALSLLDTSSDRTSTGRRNRALIALLWRAGLRPGEALSLTASDIDVDGRRATVAEDAHEAHIAGAAACKGEEVPEDSWMSVFFSTDLSTTIQK